MKILITNDDGVNSPGLQNLRDVLSKDHDVWVLAPSGDRSGVSQSITLRDPVKILRIEDQVWSCSGTPTDCVVYGTGGFFSVEFDMVISGINIGPNLGTDLLYSGTAAAARQASLHDYPAIAVSLDQFDPPYNFQEISLFIAEKIESLHERWEENIFYNINFPPDLDVDAKLEWTWPAKRLYHDEIIKMDSPREDGTFCFLKGGLMTCRDEEGSDVLAVKRGNISISAVCIAPTVASHFGKIPEKAGFCR